MPRSTHGNSNKSRRKHHLYEIRDKVKDDGSLTIFAKLLKMVKFLFLKSPEK